MSSPDLGSPFGDGSLESLESGFLVGGGRFTLKEMIGFGSHTVVWVALDEQLGEKTALKFFPKQIVAGPGVVESLRREAQRSRKLTHPNIVRVHDFIYSPDELAFVAMEYVDGSNLHDLRSEQAAGVFSWVYLRPLIEHACAALEYAHAEGFVHGNIKPTNLILDRRGRLKVADFGLRIPEETGKGLDAGGSGRSLYYRSPQELSGALSTLSDDIYSLGATIYELLSGKPPFWTGDVTHQIRNSRAQPLPERLLDFEITEEIPPHISALIVACLAKEPAQRPRTAAEIARQLEKPAEAAMETRTAESSPGLISLVPPSVQKSVPERKADPWEVEDEIPSGEREPVRMTKAAMLGVVVSVIGLSIYLISRQKQDRPIATISSGSNSASSGESINPNASMETVPRSEDAFLRRIQAGKGPAFTYRYQPRDAVGPDTNAINFGVRLIHEGPENYHASYLVPSGQTNNSVGTITYDIRPDPGYLIQDLDLSQSTAIYTRGRIRGEYSVDFGQTYREFFSTPAFQGKSFGYGRGVNLTSLNATNVIVRYILHRYDGADYKLQFLRDSDDGPTTLQISGSVIPNPESGAKRNGAAQSGDR